jgi:hypothetical protein
MPVHYRRTIVFRGLLLRAREFHEKPASGEQIANRGRIEGGFFDPASGKCQTTKGNRLSYLPGQVSLHGNPLAVGSDGDQALEIGTQNSGAVGGETLQGQGMRVVE